MFSIYLLQTNLLYDFDCLFCFDNSPTFVRGGDLLNLDFSGFGQKPRLRTEETVIVAGTQTRK